MVRRNYLSSPSVDWQRDDSMFVNILQALYHKKLVVNTIKNFSDREISSEMINNAIKNGKVLGEKSSSMTKKSMVRGKEKKVNAINESSAKFIQSLYLA